MNKLSPKDSKNAWKGLMEMAQYYGPNVDFRNEISDGIKFIADISKNKF